MLSDGDDKRVDEGYAALLAELAAVHVTKDESFTYEDKIAGLNTMFTLAMHQGRLLAAYRIASKHGKSRIDVCRIRVAVAYAEAGDLGGAWEIVGMMLRPTRTSSVPLLPAGRRLSPFEHLAQALRGVAALNGEPTDGGER